MSRRHALVTTDASGTVTILDLNSTGGTFVNDERIDEPRVLQPGDVVRFADLSARFEPAVSAPAAGRRQRPHPAAGPAPGYRCRTGDGRAAEPRWGRWGRRGASGGAAVEPPVGPPVGHPWYRRWSHPWSLRWGPAAAGFGRRSALHGDRHRDQPRAARSGRPDRPARRQERRRRPGGRHHPDRRRPGLGTTQTGSGGQFSFTSLPISLKYLIGHHKTQPDLQVQVLAGGQFLAASPVSYSAPQSVVLNVVLPAGSAGLPSEYETLTANLGAAYPGSLGALQEGNGRSDITYLANKTGWDARAVALAALADQFSQITAPTIPRRRTRPRPRPGRCDRRACSPSSTTRCSGRASRPARTPCSRPIPAPSRPSGSRPPPRASSRSRSPRHTRRGAELPGAERGPGAVRRPGGRGVHAGGDAAADAARGDPAAAVRPAVRAVSGRLGQLLAGGRAAVRGGRDRAAAADRPAVLPDRQQPAAGVGADDGRGRRPADLHPGSRRPRLLHARQVGAAHRRVDPAGHPRRGRRRAGQQLRAAARRAGPHRVPDRRPGRSGRPAAPCPSPAPRRPPRRWPVS